MNEKIRIRVKIRYIFYSLHSLLQISSASSGNDLYGNSRRDRNSIRSARSTAGAVQLCLADHVAGEIFVENQISRAKVSYPIRI